MANNHRNTVLNLVAAKSVAQLELFFHKLRWIVNLVTPKAGAWHEFLFNNPSSEAGLPNKSSCLDPALGLTKFSIVKDKILVTLFCAT